MTFRENLPPRCPPGNAVDVAYEGALRFVRSSSVRIEDFLSEASKGVNRRCDPCALASCSLFVNRSSRSFIATTRLPKFKNMRVAEINIPVGSGLSILNVESGHIDFWMYENYDPVASIIQVE